MGLLLWQTLWPVKLQLTSIDLLISSKWQNNVQRIEKTLNKELFKCASLSNVKEVRVLGAIGVVELHKNVDLASITKSFLRTRCLGTTFYEFNLYHASLYYY